MRKKFTAYIEDLNTKELKKIALEKECSVSDILNVLVDEYLNDNSEVSRVLKNKVDEYLKNK